MRAFTLILSAILFGALVSCTEPGETTGMGAVAGGAIGAGLGAIVGSATGSPGAGLAIGAAGGAATGAVVGNALQAQEETGRTQDEALERQQQEVAAQRRELDDLERARDGGGAQALPHQGSAGDGKTADNAPMGYSYPGSTMRLDPATRARYERSDETESQYQYRPVTKAEPIVSKTTTLSRHVTETEPAVAPVKKVTVARADIPPPPPSESVKSDSDGVTERDLVAPQADAETTEEKPAAVTETKEVIPALPSDNSGANTSTARVAPPQAPAAAPETSAECKQATDEVSKADSSSEVADKLFHYRRALRLCPDNAQYHVGLGNIYQSLNRKMDAEFEYREALRIDPNIEEAKKNLDSVRY